MWKPLKVGSRLFFLTALTLAVVIVIGAFGLWGLDKTGDNVNSLYMHNTQPIAELGALNGTLGKMLADMLLAWQHNPAGTLSAIHDHPIEVHLESMAMWQNLFETHWAAYKSAQMTPEERELVDLIDRSHNIFMTEGMIPLRDAMKSGKFPPDNMQGLLQTFPHGVLVETSLTKLMQLKMAQAKQNHELAMNAYSNMHKWIITVILVGILLAVFFAFSVTRSITRPLSQIHKAQADYRRRVGQQGS